jgi:hypothetical protein
MQTKKEEHEWKNFQSSFGIRKPKTGPGVMLTPVIPATHVADVRRIAVQGYSDKITDTPSQPKILDMLVHIHNPSYT